ncbi:MAG: hypothetical protein MUO37_04555 [Methyloceanibacter sp.]|jgi:hypothetical protein|nr:hypothetical protein [Methyloceanibacter sp.]
MPQLLILVAAGAGLVLAGRWYRDMQRRIASELRAAEEALQRRENESVVPLEQDPATGVYRPRVSQGRQSARH